jgi:hypothetical protein
MTDSKKTEDVVLSEAERKAAEKDGLKQAVTDAAVREAAQSPDGASLHRGGGPEPTGKARYPGMSETVAIRHLVDLPIEGLAEAIDEKVERPLTETQIAGLLEVERSGKNRTDYVKLLMKRLKVESPYDVTDAGPPFTNDTTSTSEI